MTPLRRPALLLLLAASGASAFTSTTTTPRSSAAVLAPYALPTTTITTTTTTTSLRAAGKTSEDDVPVRTSDVVSRVAVAGATGRTGSLVVGELLSRGVDVVALVRDVDKAVEKLPMNDDDDETSGSMEVIKCDLGDEQEIAFAVDGCDASIWCATGFSDAPGVPFLDKVKKILGVALTPKRSVDAVGVPALGRAFASSSDGTSGYPKVVMLSSAGVTRPSWSEEKKTLFVGSADIPIIRLNPFGILDVKAESEEELRRTGSEYCIFRPTGLNDDHPVGSRPVFSQGDVAVGRINRQDVATILVDCLTSKAATGKTFEAFTLAGYQPATSVEKALSRMKPDAEGIPSDDVLFATYTAMQQLLPGERQDAAALAMGQTYEQLDKDEVGRLGKRGEENAEAAAPKPTTS